MPQEYVDTTLLDGYAGGPHITVEQVGLANQGLYGADDYVLGTGEKAAAQILTNNSIRIFDAVYVIQGRRDVINANGYKDVSIANGSQGMNRNDIIVRRYEKDESSEIEKTSYAVIKGVPAAGVATDPEVTVGDIKNGATLHEMALYRVRLNGLNIVGIDPLFKTLVNMSEIQEMLTELNSKLSNTIKEVNIKTGYIKNGVTFRKRHNQGMVYFSSLQGYSIAAGTETKICDTPAEYKPVRDTLSPIFQSTNCVGFLEVRSTGVYITANRLLDSTTMYLFANATYWI